MTKLDRSVGLMLAALGFALLAFSVTASLRHPAPDSLVSIR